MTPPRTFDLRILPGVFGVARLAADAPGPEWAQSAPGFRSFTVTEDELSVVCADAAIPAGLTAERDLACLRVAGTLDFGQIGILSSLTATLAAAAVSIFAISTYDTDYLLLPRRRLADAVAALEAAGHRVADDGTP